LQYPEFPQHQAAPAHEIDRRISRLPAIPSRIA
jgi:hypothetical protein